MEILTAPRRRKAVRRAEILASARKVFADKGFDAAAVGEIAEGADCVEGTLYVYFRNKRDLLDAVLAEYYDGLIAEIEPKFASIEGTADRLRFLIARHLRIAVDDPGMARLIGQQKMVDKQYYGSPFHRLNQRYSRFLSRAIRDGIERGELRRDLDPSVARDLLFGGMEHRVRNALGQGQRLDVARLAKEMATMVLQGWQAPPDAAAPSRELNAIERRLGRIEATLRKRGDQA